MGEFGWPSGVCAHLAQGWTKCFLWAHPLLITPLNPFHRCQNMFELSLPWWEFLIRGTLVYVCLLVMVRLSGKRTVGQFTPFDLLVVMLISEAVSNSLSGGDASLFGGLMIAATLIALNLLTAFVAARSETSERWLAGSPVLIGRDGKFFDDVIRRNHVGQIDLEQALREADCDQPDMACAFLEVDGAISIRKRNES